MAEPYVEILRNETYNIDNRGCEKITSNHERESLQSDAKKSLLNSNLDRSSFFRLLDEERNTLAEATAQSTANHAEPWSETETETEDDSMDEEAETEDDSMDEEEAYMTEWKIIVPKAASKIDASDLAAFLADISTTYEDKQDMQLRQFAEYFNQAFSSVSASQFPWTRILKESTVEELINMPVSYISEPVYKTSVRWISKHSGEALDEFFSESLIAFLPDFGSELSNAESSKKSVQHVPSKAQVANFVVLAMVLRQKPDVLFSQLSKLRDGLNHDGQDRFPFQVWVICQACVGDPVVGIYSLVQNLLPVVGMHSYLRHTSPVFGMYPWVENMLPHYEDLVLELVERILSDPNARSILLKGAVRMGERLVPPTSLQMLMLVTYPPRHFRAEVPTKRFQAIYPTLKELALARSPGTKAIKQVSLELLAITTSEMMCESSPELTKEAASIFMWCLAHTDSCKQWEKLHMVKIGRARFATFLQTLAGQVKEVKEQERQKIEQGWFRGAKVKHQTSFRDADTTGVPARRRSVETDADIASGLLFLLSIALLFVCLLRMLSSALQS